MRSGAVIALAGTPAIFAIRSMTGAVVMSCARTWARAVSGSKLRLRSAADKRGESTRMCVSAVPLDVDR